MLFASKDNFSDQVAKSFSSLGVTSKILVLVPSDIHSIRPRLLARWTPFLSLGFLTQENIGLPTNYYCGALHGFSLLAVV